MMKELTGVSLEARSGMPNLLGDGRLIVRPPVFDLFSGGALGNVSGL